MASKMAEIKKQKQLNRSSSTSGFAKPHQKRQLSRPGSAANQKEKKQRPVVEQEPSQATPSPAPKPVKYQSFFDVQDETLLDSKFSSNSGIKGMSLKKENNVRLMGQGQVPLAVNNPFE